MRSRWWILVGLAPCAAGAPPCPSPPAPPALRCPDGAAAHTVGTRTSCRREDGTLSGPWVRRDAAGEVIAWGAWDEGLPTGRSWSVTAQATVLTEHEGGRAVRTVRCGPDGRVRRREGPEGLAEWTDDGRPIRATDVEDGVTTRVRRWEPPGVLAVDVPRDGWAVDGAGRRVRMVDGWPVGRLDADGERGSRLVVTRVVRDAAAVTQRPEPGLPPGFGRDRLDPGDLATLCDPAPPGLACEGRAEVWERGALTLEGTWVDGRREGPWRSRPAPSRPWTLTWYERGRDLWWATEGAGPSGAGVSLWVGEVLLAREGRPSMGARGAAPVPHLGPAPAVAWTCRVVAPARASCEGRVGGRLVEAGRYTLEGETDPGAWSVGEVLPAARAVPVQLDGPVVRFTPDGALVAAGAVRDGAPVGTWLEVRDEGLHQGALVADAGGAFHRVGTWTVRDRSTLRVVGTRAWVAGRPDDGLVRLTRDMPLPSAPLDPDALARAADAVAGAGPDDPALPRCWHARDGAWRATPDGARPLPTAWVLAELLRRGDATPGARACLGELAPVLAAGPAWAELAVELRAAITPMSELPDDLEVLRRAVALPRAPDGWAAAVGEGLDDARWRPWLAGWFPGADGGRRPPDALPRVRRVVLDDRVLWLLTGPREEGGVVTARTEAVVVPPDPERGPAVGQPVHLPHGPILGLEVVDTRRLRVRWTTPHGPREEVMVLARDEDPRAGCEPAPGDRYAWALEPEDLTAPAVCDRGDLR